MTQMNRIYADFIRFNIFTSVELCEFSVGLCETKKNHTELHREDTEFHRDNRTKK